MLQTYFLLKKWISGCSFGLVVPLVTSSYTEPGAGDALQNCAPSLSRDCHSSSEHIRYTKSSKLSVVLTSELVLTAITDKKKKRDGECYNAALPFFFDSLNGCSLCICWQNHSVQNKSSSVTHQERVHLSASSMAMPHCKGLREVVLGFGGELLLSN